ncbi:centromere protein Q [Thalassophryne amazonica]|uniref:centromere protein Q n=1 Tax=Thalassophryne amazonica TaxID=390379 RepID=UPI0014725216|nr:centromere protein Q [Thalassophryne amazonica]
MKPVRGSSRASSSEPKSKKKKTEKKSTQPQQQETKDNIGKNSKSTRKKKAEGPSSDQNKLKHQTNWKLMPRSSITALEGIMDLSILAALAVRQTGRKESQKHLNMMKTRFLAQCAELKVPVQKQRDLDHLSSRHQEETKKLFAAKKALHCLESGLSTTVGVLEKIEEQSASLQHQCSSLREKVEEEEEKAKEILQLPEETVLSLQPFPHRTVYNTLEGQGRKSVPDVEITARQLGDILQKSQAIQDAKALLQHAHKHADRLFQQDFVSGAPCPEGT